MMAAPPPPGPALAESVRGGRWAEVRTVTDSLPQPLQPEMALAAARAARSMGEPTRALDVLRGAIPRAGELGPALRLEAAAAAEALGQDPFPFLAPLLAKSGPSAPRRAAEARLRRAWESLPLRTLRRVPRAALPRSLRRDLAALLAVRTGDQASALRIVVERVGDEAALRSARWLAGAKSLPPGGALSVAEALLAGGSWRDADAFLATQKRPVEERLRWRWAFLRGRAAYRLGDLGRASAAFDDALAAATSDADRFAAAVQCARSTEIAGDAGAAIAFWDTARAAGPKEVEGWDGGARARTVAGRTDEAVALLQSCPVPVMRVAGPRLAAMLLARGDRSRARTVLARLPDRLPVVQALWVGLLAADGDVEGARTRAAAVLADARAGAWREMVLDLLPGRQRSPNDVAQPIRDPVQIGRMAASQGVECARAALAAALGADPQWARLLAGEPAEPAAWTGPAQRLVAVGMDHDAALVFPTTFPHRSPEEGAWAAAHLAEWGNQPAALTAGEDLWGRLGPLPAIVLPRRLLRHILPLALVTTCSTTAREAGLPAQWLVGIIRQESRFESDAYSPAGAIGLAQLVPDVGLRMGASPADLRRPDIALRLAASEVTRLGARFGPRLSIVAAAYNAGDAVVSSWLAGLGGSPTELVFAAAIPYRETAGYVLAVREGAELASYLGQDEDADRRLKDGAPGAPPRGPHS